MSFIFQNNVHHPKTNALGLANEKVVLLSGTSIRVSVVTESNKVATWMDESLTHAATAAKLEHPAQLYSEFVVDHIVSIHTCPLYSLARLESGALYWWYVLYVFIFFINKNIFICFIYNYITI